MGDFFAQMRLSGGGGGGGSAATSGETQLYKDIMAYLAESASPEPDFSKYDFSQFSNISDEEPVNFLEKMINPPFIKNLKKCMIF
uniref:Uncharacterized protein n=1 Tax=Chryseobacterium endophyticum TaxID=1854762 RepID=A0AAU6WUY2_9FLAO